MALLKGTSEADTISGTTLADTIYGYGGDDSLDAGLGADILYGGAGNDTLWSDLYGPDRLDGGQGTDLAVIFRTETDVGLKINISAGGLGMNIGDGTRLWSIERLSCTGGWGNDTLVGGNLSDFLDGYEGRDTIKGEGGDDRLFGGEGNDVLFGGAGNDNINCEKGADTVYGGSGADQIYALDGAANLSNSVLTLYGQDGDDMLEGGKASDLLSGGDGNDYVRALQGNDRVFGNAGDDRLTGGAGADTINGGAGEDIANYEDMTVALRLSLADPARNTGDAAGDVLSSIEIVLATVRADTLEGNAGNNEFWGNDGDDRIYGLAGDDSLAGMNGNDQLIGGAGNDTFSGRAGNDTIDGQDAESWHDTLYFGYIPNFGVVHGAVVNLQTGTADDRLGGTDKVIDIESVIGCSLDDKLIGGNVKNDSFESFAGMEGNDTINGGSGRDVIEGGEGLDLLTGGTGGDKFVYSRIVDSGVSPASRDVVVDFQHLQDKIDVHRIDAVAGGTNDSFDFIGSAGFSAAGQIRAVNSSDGTVLQFNTQGESGAEMTIMLSGVSAGQLSASDFIL